MKQRLLGACFVFVLLLAPSLVFLHAQEADIDPNPTDSVCINLTKNLRYRDRDANASDFVSSLQDFLSQRGYINFEPTGFFGINTFNAVKKFQKDSGFSPTGYVGPLTREKIKNLTCGASEPSQPETPSTPAPSTMSGFIVCLKDRGVKMFSYSGSPYYKYQKTLFGEYVPYIECNNADGSQTVDCIKNKIIAYPTWVFGDDTRDEGVQTLKRLAEKTKCVLPIDWQRTAKITSGSETTSLTPTIHGKAVGVTQLGVTLGGFGGKYFGSGLIPVVDGSWSVTVAPPLLVGQYTVYVYDENSDQLTTGQLNVISSTSTKPSITIISPNGGEMWQGKEVVKWTTNNVPATNGVTMVARYYSDGQYRGSNYIDYPLGNILNDGDEVVDTTRLPVGGPYALQIKALVNGVKIDDWSDSYFKVGPVTTSTSFIKVLSPSTNSEAWRKDTVQPINWSWLSSTSNTSLVAGVDIYLVSPTCTGEVCSMGFIKPILIAKGTGANLGGFEWTVGKTLDGSILGNGDKFSIQVCLSGTDTCGTGANSFKYVIETVNQPKISDFWTDKSSYRAGEAVVVYAKFVDVDGSPFTPGEGGHVSINRVPSVSGESGWGGQMTYNNTTGHYEWKTSAGSVTDYVYAMGYGDNIQSVITPRIPITVGTAGPLIKVTSPNGGESFVSGQTITVVFNTNLPAGTRYEIMLIDKYFTESIGYGAQIASGDTEVSGAQKVSAVIPKNVSDGSSYLIWIAVGCGDPATCAQDKSDNYFSIVALTSQPSITVLSPNGGEVYTKISNNVVPITVKWSSANTSLAETIDVIRLRAVSDGREYNFANDVLVSDGQEVIGIPTSMPDGQYKVEIKGYTNDNTLLFDSSDYSFSVVTPIVQPTITVTSPNGGEKWIEGTDNKITWTPSNLQNASLPTIDEYIIDAYGNNIIPPALNRGNSGWDAWAPHVTGSFKVKICQPGTTNCDTSDDFFTIAAPTTKSSISLVSPNGGEVYNVGGTMKLQWDLPGVQNSEVNAYLFQKTTSSDYYFVNTLLFRAQNVTEYTVTVPQVPTGNNYYVRVLCYNLVSCTNHDDSSGAFTINSY